MSLLHIDKVTLRFGGLTAVNNVDVQVEPGQIFSIIGPNGAGKTTVFNTVTGIYEPTAGRILFLNADSARPLNWGVYLTCALIGLFTACLAMLLTANVDQLWKATIKHNIPADQEKQPFDWSNVWRDFRAYLRGEMILEKNVGLAARVTPWKITSADGQVQLTDVLGKRPQDLNVGKDAAAKEAAARKYLQDIQTLLSLKPEERKLHEADDHWQILADDGQTILASYNSAEEANLKLTRLETFHSNVQHSVWMAWFSFFGGLFLGSSGAFVLWYRARRTPDVIAARGIARTFQNIRLFQNMTVLDNVLLGMNRSFHCGWLRTVLHTPRWKREEADARHRAMQLLNFIGLAEKHPVLAKNLPYGDQRRLEIARALAAQPKLILLDEPAAGMNPTESGELTKLIRAIREQGITVLLIEHHMKVVMGISDRIAVLEYGTKIAEGTPAEIRANPRVIEAYLGKEEQSVG